MLAWQSSKGALRRALATPQPREELAARFACPLSRFTARKLLAHFGIPELVAPSPVSLPSSRVFVRAMKTPSLAALRWISAVCCILVLAKGHAQQTVSEAVRARTAEAQREAIKLYPALADSSSELNAKFVEAVKVAREKRDPVLSDPNWPLIIADRLAEREGLKPPKPPEPKRNEYGLEVDDDGFPLLVKAAIREKLKDPDPLRISSCELKPERGGGVMATVWFNAKNSYGGYGNLTSAAVIVRPDGRTSCYIGE